MVKEREILKLPGKVFDAIRFGISWGLMTQKKSSNVEKDTDVLDGIDNLKLEQSGSNSTTTNKISIKITDQSIDDNPRLFAKLSPALQNEAKLHKHLWVYLTTVDIDKIGVPTYYEEITREVKNLPYKNLIYPVANAVYIHLVPDKDDSRDTYIAIEPSMDPEVAILMEEVDNFLIDYVEDLKNENELPHQTILLNCLEEICTTDSVPSKNKIHVTEEQYKALQYLMLRDKDGLGTIQPVISDPNIEDISCSGVGTLFLEHKIFGGVKAGIQFDSEAELDQFVIKLSEKINRPVTVRDPIVDAVLPDGSRVNIVFGTDVSKRGSNFTIRKFNDVPISALDLVTFGSINYEMLAYISIMLGEGMNTFVSGETASGKTTLLNAISTFIPPTSKIVSIEDTPELQVPHDNWIREVVRGSAGSTGTGAAVTMFDLLRAALRQRPNEIIIGEIRGAEGAIAFQAMQTGHACMATFHAATVEKLIQRMTGDPINVPKAYIDNLNLVIIQSAVKLPNGSIGRRCMSINEIIEYDPETNSFGFIEVFRWNPTNDTFEFPGYMNTALLEGTVAQRRGIPERDSRLIYEEIDKRAAILKRLHERGVTNFYELNKTLGKAYREGLFK
jgi:flagellar protein FlaI